MSKKAVKKRVRAKAPSHRKLAAIMFTDIVGFTALNQSDEGRALELLEMHNKLLRPLFSGFNGREVKTIGDSFLVEFDSALEATLCAIRVQESLRDYNLSAREGWKIKVRIGIHVGDVVRKGKDILGDAVNIASRIEPLAEAEGVCISGQVFDQVHNKIAYSARQLERTELKNVNFQINVYSLEIPWRQRGEKLFSPQQRESTYKAERMRVAVLPFSNMSPDPNDEYFADGMTEEVISTVSKIQGLEVISRTSIVQYKKNPKPIGIVSKELAVGTILEGSVRKAGNRLRISTQMIDAALDHHVWAESYDRELQDVFTIQSDIARKVADALEARMPKGVSSDEADRRENVGAYTSYLRAMQLSHEGTESSLNQAISLLERAIDTDRRFARAYATLANVWDEMAAHGYEDYTAATRKAEVAAERAVELAPDLAEGHAALAEVYALLDRNRESISEAQKAIQLNPNLCEAHISLGILLGVSDDLGECLAKFEKAFKLDPLSYKAGDCLAQVYMALGRTSDALVVLQKLRDLNPRYAKIYIRLADCYIDRREFSRAQEMIDLCFEIDPRDAEGKLEQGVLYAHIGRKDEALTILDEIMESEGESMRLWGQLWIQSALGNFDAVFKALMRMGERHDWPFLIKHMPDLNEVRRDPRFAEFCSAVGISPPREK